MGAWQITAKEGISGPSTYCVPALVRLGHLLLLFGVIMLVQNRKLFLFCAIWGSLSVQSMKLGEFFDL